MGQTLLALMPISKLRILFLVKAVIVPPTFLALFLWAVVVTHGGGELVTGEMRITSSYMNTAYSALTGLNVIIGLFSSLAVNMPVSALHLFLTVNLGHADILLLRTSAGSPRIDLLGIINSSRFPSSARSELSPPSS